MTQSLGGIFTCIRDSIAFKSIIVLDEPSYLFTLIRIKSGVLTVVNCYIPTSRKASHEQIRKIINHKESIICGDINAYSPIFGARYTDARGMIFEELIHDYRLVSLNTGEDTYDTEGSYYPNCLDYIAVFRNKNLMASA